jgi:hypothetical protein
MMILLAALITLGSIFGGEPKDVDKDVMVLNDTREQISVRVDDGASQDVARKAGVEVRVPEFGVHAVYVTRADGGHLERRFNLDAPSGYFDAPHAHRFCVSVEHSHVELLAPQVCLSRVKRLARGR